MEAPPATAPATEAFDALDQLLRANGPAAALDRLVQQLADAGEFRALLDALLLKARHELNIPLIQVGTLSELPEPARSQYEERYVEAIRSVGQRLLETGDVVGAWPYFRAIAEKEPVAAALEGFEPAEGDERLSSVVDVAFNQGAHPRRGFELILTHYGTCSAISAFEHLPPDDTTRVPCADRLVRHLHEQLTASLRADIARRGQPMPLEGTSIAGLLAGRDWLFADEAYHIDTSHLSATVRLALILTDPATIRQAIDLTDYGRRLSQRYQYEGDPPFEHVYEDHAVFLRALVGEDVDAAITHFRNKIAPADPDTPLHPADSLPAQVLVRLLVRLERIEQAIDVGAEFLAEMPESALICPSVAQLCQRAGQPERLARIAREHGDLVGYAAAILQTGAPAGG